VTDVLRKEQNMKKQKMGSFLITTGILSVLTGLGFTWLFAWAVGDPFLQVLPVGFWLGPLLGLIMSTLRFTLGWVVEDSISYNNKEDFLTKLKIAFQSERYRLLNENGNSSRWTCTEAFEGIIFGDVTVQLEDASAIVVGPRGVVRGVKRRLQSLS
jgi:hypothetical protein